MLLKGFRRVKTSFPPCRPGESEKLNANVDLGDNIDPVFPYLNAKTKGTYIILKSGHWRHATI